MAHSITDTNTNGYPDTNKYVDKLFTQVKRDTIEEPKTNGVSQVANGVQHKDIEVRIECEVHADVQNKDLPDTSEDMEGAENQNYLCVYDEQSGDSHEDYVMTEMEESPGLPPPSYSDVNNK